MEKTNLSKEKLLLELNKKLLKLTDEKIHYIVYVAEELNKGTPKYKQKITNKQAWKYFDEWKAKRTAARISF